MKPLNIIIGSSAPATEQMLEKYDLITVPFKLTWEGIDGLNDNNLLEKMSNLSRSINGNGPKTSQPSIGIYKKAFEESLKNSEKVLYISISSKLSGAYNSAVQAKKMIAKELQDNIYIFDSMHADSSELMLAIKARELSNQGHSIEEVIEKLDSLKKEIKLFASIGTSAWLEAGGRISHTVAIMIEQMQKIGMRPIIIMKEGEIKPASLKIQSNDPATAVFKTFEELTKDMKSCRIIITHGNAIEEAEKLKKMIEEKYTGELIIELIGSIGPIIGAHIGPGALICCLSET